MIIKTPPDKLPPTSCHYLSTANFWLCPWLNLEDYSNCEFGGSCHCLLNTYLYLHVHFIPKVFKYFNCCLRLLAQLICIFLIYLILYIKLLMISLCVIMQCYGIMLSQLTAWSDVTKWSQWPGLALMEDLDHTASASWIIQSDQGTCRPCESSLCADKP